MSRITFEELYDIGKKLYERHDYSRAKEIFQRLYRWEPKNALVLAQLSRCWWMNKKYLHSYRCGLRAYRINPDLAEPWVIFGNYTENDDIAELYFWKAIRLNPQFEVPWNNLGNIYYRKMNLEKAKKYFQKALEIRPDYEISLTNLASIYVIENDFSNAKLYLYRALNHCPDYAEGWYELGSLYQKMNNTNSAEFCFRKSIQLDPNLRFLQGDLRELYENHPFYAELFQDRDISSIINQISENEPALDLLLQKIAQGQIPRHITQYPWLGRYFDLISKVCQRSQLNSSIIFSQMEAAAWNHTKVELASHYRIFL